jgi:hypothetical protein
LHHLENQKLHKWCKTHFLWCITFYVTSFGALLYIISYRFSDSETFH